VLVSSNSSEVVSYSPDELVPPSQRVWNLLLELSQMASREALVQYSFKKNLVEN